MDGQSNTKRIQQKRQIMFLEERQKFLDNMLTFRSLAVEMGVISRELKCLHEESNCLHAEVRSLKSKLNQTAVEFGLQPLP